MSDRRHARVSSEERRFLRALRTHVGWSHEGTVYVRGLSVPEERADFLEQLGLIAFRRAGRETAMITAKGRQFLKSYDCPGPCICPRCQDDQFIISAKRERAGRRLICEICGPWLQFDFS